MTRWQLIALLLGLLVLAAPLGRLVDAEDDPEDYEDDDDEAAPATDSSEKDVVVGTEANWDDKIGKAKFALVEFYAPWCGHCKKLTPEWAKAATLVKEYDASIVIAKIDATAEKSLGEKYGVQGYPTIKWFVDGELAMDYNGPRDADGIFKWVKKKSGPAATTLESTDALSELEAKEEVVILGYFSAFEGEDYNAFIKVAQTSEDVTFAQTSSADVAKAAGLTASGVAAITNFKGEARATAVNSGDDLKEFITAEKLPPTIEFNDQNSQKIFNSGIEKQVLLIAKSSDLEADSKVFQAYKNVAKALKGKLVFVTVDLDGSSKDPVVNFFGLKEEDAPTVVGFFMNNNKKYKLLEPVSEESIKKFAESVVDGTATVEYKSAPIPEDDLDGDVKIVVGKSFDSIVKDADKDVLLEVYAPWCGHCKSLEPIYKKLAKRFKKVDSVVIAKMDGTENEHPDIEVKGFPTILFFPAGEDKTAITFEGGDRSLKSLTKFIKKNAKVAYELPKKKESGDEAADTKDEL